MRGRRFSRDIRESVSCATKLGLDPTIIEAVTGVSKRQIQRIAFEEEHRELTRNQDRGRRTRQRLLKSEHLEVSRCGTTIAVHLFTKGTYLIISS